MGKDGARAPESLAGLSSPINVVNNVSPGASGAAAGGGSLLEQMMKQMPAQTAVPDITGLSQLQETIKAVTGQSGSAHDKALEASQGMAKAALDSLVELAKTAATVASEVMKEPEGKLTDNPGLTSGIQSAIKEGMEGGKNIELNVDQEENSIFLKTGGSGQPEWTFYKALPPMVAQIEPWTCWAAAMDSWSHIRPGAQYTQEELIDLYGDKGPIKTGSLNPEQDFPIVASQLGINFEVLKGINLKAAFVADMLRKFGHVLFIFNQDSEVSHTVVVYGIGYPSGTTLQISMMDPSAGGSYVNKPFEEFKAINALIVGWPTPFI